MGQLTIALGSADNDGNGDTLRAAGSKINSNFTQLFGGTEFPEDPVSGDRFRKTDERVDYTFNGTLWLSDHVECLALTAFENISSTTFSRAPVPLGGTQGIYLLDWSLTSYRNGSGEWDATLSWITAADVVTVLDTLDGAGRTANTWYRDHRPLNTVLDSTAHNLRIGAVEASGTSTYYQGAALRYCLIGA